jgi:hypothetical protein
VKRQSWFLIVTDGATKEMVIMVTKMDFRDKDGNDTNTAVFELKQRFGKAGSFSFFAMFKCDAYVGFDREVELKFDIKEDDPSRVIPEYSQEDFEAVNGPSMVETLISGDTTKDEDSDVNED